MPLNRDDLLAGERRLRRVIIDLLRENANLAYTVEEVAVEVGFLGIPASFAEVEHALSELVGRTVLLLDSREGSLYYSYDSRFGLRPSR